MHGNYRHELPQLQLKSFLTECREIKQRRRRRQRERPKREIGLDWQNNSSARASRFFLISRFMKGREHKTTTFFFFS